jgi:hypothetical protein
MSKDVMEEIKAVVPYLHPEGTIVIDNLDYPQPDGSTLGDGVEAAAAECGLACRIMEAQEDSSESEQWDPVGVLCRNREFIDSLVEK